MYICNQRGEWMNFVTLKYVLEIAKTGSISKAAENLYIAQPNMSRAVKELEGSLGVTLFARTSKGMKPTPEGEKLIYHAEKILKQVETVEELFKDNSSKKQFFSISVPRATYIADAFCEFSKTLDADTKAQIYYKETNAQRTVDNVIHGISRLGIVRYDARHDKYFKDMFEEKGLSYELVAEFTFKIVMSVNSPLANKETVSSDDLGALIEIAHPDPFVPSFSTAQILEDELSGEINRRIFVYERASQFELLSNNPETFMFMSPMPEYILKKHNLIEKTYKGTTKIKKDVLIHKKDYQLTKLDKDFITELCNARRRSL